MNCEWHRQEQAHWLSQAHQVTQLKSRCYFNLAKPARWLHGPMQTWHKASVGFTSHCGSQINPPLWVPSPKDTLLFFRANLQVPRNNHCYAKMKICNCRWPPESRCDGFSTPPHTSPKLPFLCAVLPHNRACWLQSLRNVNYFHRMAWVGKGP